jgi:hypothetical protein
VGLLGFMYGKQVSQHWHYVKENGMPRHEPCKSGGPKGAKESLEGS